MVTKVPYFNYSTTFMTGHAEAVRPSSYVLRYILGSLNYSLPLTTNHTEISLLAVRSDTVNSVSFTVSYVDEFGVETPESAPTGAFLPNCSEITDSETCQLAFVVGECQ